MKYVLLIYQGLDPPLPRIRSLECLAAGGTGGDLRGLRGAHQGAGRHPGLPLGLPDAARTVQMRNGKPEIKNGTYLSEGAGGYLVLEAEAWTPRSHSAARIPAARHGGAIEIRPAEQYW